MFAVTFGLGSLAGVLASTIGEQGGGALNDMNMNTNTNTTTTNNMNNNNKKMIDDAGRDVRPRITRWRTGFHHR